jgi:hypothetical protein
MQITSNGLEEPSWPSIFRDDMSHTAGFAALCFGDTVQDPLDQRIGLPSALRNRSRTGSLRGWGVSATTAAEKL